MSLLVRHQMDLFFQGSPENPEIQAVTLLTDWMMRLFNRLWEPWQKK